MTIAQASINCMKAKLSGTKFPIISQRQRDAALKYAEQQRTKNKIAPDNRSAAAVLVPICSVGGNPSILFTLRSSTVRAHKSEISFPGGHVEECDNASFANAAMRETQEELKGTYNYDQDVYMLGETEWVPSANGMPVTPVLAVFTKEFRDEQHIQQVFPPSSSEVEMVFTRTIEELLKSEASEPLPRLGSLSPIFPGKEGKIWGLTAFILQPLLHHIIDPCISKIKPI